MPWCLRLPGLPAREGPVLSVRLRPYKAAVREVHATGGGTQNNHGRGAPCRGALCPLKRDTTLRDVVLG